MKTRLKNFIFRFLAGMLDYLTVLLALIVFSAFIGLPFARVFTPDDTIWPLMIVYMIIMPFKFIMSEIPYVSYDGAYIVFLLMLFVIESIYHSIWDISRARRTVGHIAINTIVVNTDGTKPSIPKIILRNCLKTISRYLYGSPLLTILFTKKNQALHDILTGTMVVSKITK